MTEPPISDDRGCCLICRVNKQLAHDEPVCEDCVERELRRVTPVSGKLKRSVSDTRERTLPIKIGAPIPTLLAEIGKLAVLFFNDPDEAALDGHWDAMRTAAKAYCAAPDESERLLGYGTASATGGKDGE